MGAGHSAEVEGGAYASDPPLQERRKCNQKRRRHSVDSVASYSSQNHVDRIRTQNFSAASCHEDSDVSSVKSKNFRRSSLEFPSKRPESVTSNTSSTRSRLRELVERKSQDEHKPASNAVGDLQYFENPTETLEFDKQRNAQEKKSTEERPKKKKIIKSKEKEKETCENKSKKHEKYQSKLAEYYKLPVQLPQDEFYQHLTKSKAAEELLQKRLANSDTEFNGSYGRLCKHKETEGPNLRRSRSLAVIREETFTDLQLQNHNKNKRSQLIPRARLFDKPCFKDRLPGRAKYQTKEEVLENIYIESTASCFADISRQRENDNNLDAVDKSDKEDVLSTKESIHSRSITGSWPNLTEENLKNINLSEDSINQSRNPSEIDSLDSNYVRKHYNFDAHLKSNYKEGTPDTERSSDTINQNSQIYFNTEDRESDNEIRDNIDFDNVKCLSNNNSPDLNDTTKIEDNIKISEHCNDVDSYHEISIKSKDNIDFLKPAKSVEEISKEIDIQSLQSENDGTISSPPDSITSYISISIPSSVDKSQKLEYLTNSLAEKIDEYCESQCNENITIITQSESAQDKIPKVDENPIYTKVGKKRTYADTKPDKLFKNQISNEPPIKHDDIYITNTYLEKNDFLIENEQFYCTSTKNITTEPFVTTLIENQYYSLPDINISKCLRKCERIDAQLREEDPEDIPYENTYEIAQAHFREILSTKVNENYGQLNTNNPNSNTQENQLQLITEYPQPHLIQNFTRLEDDLKSIITVNSSNFDEKESIENNSIDTHQNEREINEIEGTIRNNKVITKSESLKLSSGYTFKQNNLYASVSTDQIHQLSKDKKPKTCIRKHYSLRQREPTDEELDRLPSPATVERNFKQGREVTRVSVGENKNFLSRVQSFKGSAETNISIVPLSGHQTIIINPPIQFENNQDFENIQKASSTLNNTQNNSVSVFEEKNSSDEKSNVVIHNLKKAPIIDKSSNCTPKDPFITIKLNKVVKTTIPKLKKETSDKIASVQYKFEKPPSRLIIKDNKESNTTITKKTTCINMSRPQVLQVVDSKNFKQIPSTNYDIKDKVSKEDSVEQVQSNEGIIPIKTETVSVKDKINNAIKTDIEYQEKLHSVKNYWSKLIDRTPDNKTEQNQTVREKLEVNNNNKNINGIITEEQKDENRNNLENTVGNIIKSIESVKIVDSIRKISQTKLQLWKDESEKVKDDSEVEETMVRKIVKDHEESISNDKEKNEKNIKKKEISLCTRDTPEIEIVELSSDDNQNQKTQATLIKAKGYEKGCNDFDHVRYKVMKSELFKNSMIANYRKEAQFDGLLQYLQDYSFQELLVNNNIVIIEPVRTKIEPAPRKTNNTCKISPILLKKNETNPNEIEKSKNTVRKHFFYHPIRVNKEIIEEELPNPDTVKKVRNLFEDTLKMKSPMTHDPPIIDESTGLTRRATSHRNLNEDSKVSKIGCRKKVIRQLTIDTTFNNKKWDNASLSSGVSSGDLSSNNEYETDGLSPYTNKNLKEHAYSSSSEEYLCDSVTHDFCCESQYVSPDIMKKIRECGTSVTYYGGKILNSKTGSVVSPMTKAIMDEIKSLQKNCSRDCYLCQTKCRGDKCSCLIADQHKLRNFENKQYSSTSSDSGNQEAEKPLKRKDSFPGFKFKLVKSNSCSSRLELTGTDESKNPRLKVRKQSGRADDPPLINEDDNSVKNKICRLESYNKGYAKTPFENSDEDTKTISKPDFKVTNEDNSNKSNSNQPIRTVTNLKSITEKTRNQTVSANPRETSEKQLETEKDDHTDKSSTDPHTFEKKFYYVNDTMEQNNKTTTGKFGEMVFEEFEVLESCYDSLNSNKSVK